MSIEIADIVTSLNGRDKGKSFVVIRKDEQYSYLVDGKGRRLERPKKKKIKHTVIERKTGDRLAGKLLNGDKVTNNEIRRELAEFYANKAEGGM